MKRTPPARSLSRPEAGRSRPTREREFPTSDAKQPIEMALPFTVGKWEKSEPVQVELTKGKNVLRFSRQGDIKGVTIKDFTLTPVSR